MNNWLLKVSLDSELFLGCQRHPYIVFSFRFQYGFVFVTMYICGDGLCTMVLPMKDKVANYTKVIVKKEEGKENSS